MVERAGAGRSFEGMPTAIVTGASRGLGLALARALAERGWRLVIDAREPGPLHAAAAELPDTRSRIAGDVADAEHRAALVAAAGDGRPARQQRLDPRPEPAAGARRLPARRARARLPRQRPRAARADPARAAAQRVLNVSSDAAVEPYEGWGGYGSAKAALDHLSAILAVEHHDLRVYAVDPGDMNTRLHQEAFPGEDISDRPPPEDERPRPARADRGRPPERPLPGAGAGRSAGVTALAGAAAAASAPRRGAADGRPGRAGSSTPTSSTSPTTCARATC